MDLVALADFNAVATHGGFGPASRATGQPKASLSRRVRALEAELGVRLVERGARTLKLTEEGAALHRRTAALLAELDGIGEEVSSASGLPRGRLRVSVPAMMATMAGLGSAAARFIEQHPEVRLEIVAEDRFVDPVADGYDVIIRANPAPDSALVGQMVRGDTFVVAAHPALPLPRGRETTANAPVSVSAVTQIGAAPDEIWRMVGPSGALAIAPMSVLRVSSLAMVREAVLAGAGAGIFPRGRVAADLAAGRLVAWGDVPDKRVEVWALHPSRRLASAKVRLFIAAIREMFAELDSANAAALEHK